MKPERLTYSYVTLFHYQDLIEDLKYELTGKFERLIVSLMRTPAYLDAKEIHDAVKVWPFPSCQILLYHASDCSILALLCFKGVGTNEKCLIEILASRNNKQTQDMVEAYKDGEKLPAWSREIMFVIMF